MPLDVAFVSWLMEVDFYKMRENFERDLLLMAIGNADGNSAAAARSLSMKRTTFIEKCRALDIDTRSPVDITAAQLPALPRPDTFKSAMEIRLFILRMQRFIDLLEQLELAYEEREELMQAA